MFSENNQISGRQVFRLLTYDFLGMGTLLLPTMLADTAGRDGIFCILAGIVHIFVLEIIEISVERHENKLSRLFEAEVWKSMRLCALGRIFSVFYPYGFVHGVSVFHADVKWSCGKRQLLSGADVDITARILWNGRWDRGQGESVRDAVLVSDDTAVSDVICGVQGGEASLLEPGFCGGWKRNVKRKLLCIFLLFYGVNRTFFERIRVG